ncbi:MAG: DUF2203 domain-containing protein [Chloroflexia bacterium]|nr:DUF2203 domain-containing protein [Chloroflexia bacterium]
MSERDARDPRDPATWPLLFTEAESNALLPEIVPLLMEMRARKVELDTCLAALEKLTPAMRLNGHAADARELEARIHELSTELAAGVDHLNDQGIEIKSLDHGLIDFPARCGDRVIYLCWRLGEGPTIRYWHEIDAGFAGRRAL